MDDEAERPKKLVTQEYDLLISFPFGFDKAVLEELNEKASAEVVWKGVGAFRIKSRTEPQTLISSMRSLHYVCAYAYAGTIDPKTYSLEDLKLLGNSIDWTGPAELWAKMFPDKLSPIETPAAVGFKVECERRGSHTFKSPEAAKIFSEGVNAKTYWKTKVKGYDMVIQMDIIDEQIWIGLLLHTQQLSIRNRGDLGMTVLNNAIAYGMARLANIQPGDVVVDPMAGVGTIPIEASQSWPNAVYYCGDRDKKCVQASQNNMLKFGAPSVSTVLWDARKMPFAPNTVDVVLCDLPFGRRVGTHKQNQSLYAKFFKELTRVVKVGGRVLLMTIERKILTQVIQTQSRHGWTLVSETYVDNGYKATLFELLRTVPLPNPLPATTGSESNAREAVAEKAVEKAVEQAVEKAAEQAEKVAEQAIEPKANDNPSNEKNSTPDRQNEK